MSEQDKPSASQPPCAGPKNSSPNSAAAQAEPSPPDSTSDKLEALQQAAQTIAGIKQIICREVREAGDGDAVQVLAALELHSSLDAEARGRALAEFGSLFASHHLSLDCAVFDAAHWQRQAAGNDPAIELSLTPAPLRARALYRYWKAASDHPATARRHLLSILMAHVRSADLLSSTQQLPAEICLHMMAQQLHNALSLIYASKDAVFEPGPSAHETYRELFADDPILCSQDLALLHRLRGLASQASIRVGLDGALAHDRVDWPRKELGQFYRRVKRELAERLTDERLRRRLRWQRWVVFGAVTAAMLAVAIAAVVYLRPEASRMQPPEPVHAGGIEAIYYKDKGLKHEVRRAVTAGIALNTRGAPVPELGVNNFSIRWQGFIHFAHGGLKVICGESDDGQRIYVNDKLVVDDWKPHGTQRHCGEIRTRAGWYPLRVEYFESGGNAVMRLFNGPSKDALKPIKASSLCCGQVAGAAHKK